MANRMILEGTGEFQRGFDLVTGEIPVIVVDPFDDDTPIVASCDLSNPESCESCQ